MKRNVLSMVEKLAEHKKSFASEARRRAQEFKKYSKQIESFYCFLQECLGLNYAPTYSDFDLGTYWGPTVVVDNLRDFSKIHQIVGTLQQAGIEPLKDDARCRDVNVTLRSKDKDNPYHFIKFQFRKKLPRGSKCKVQKVVRTDYKVVCER